MASAEIEAELTRIRKQVLGYKARGQIEELTYLVGAAMAVLENLGCPIHSLRLRSEKIVDSWANSDLESVKRRRS